MPGGSPLCLRSGFRTRGSGLHRNGVGVDPAENEARSIKYPPEGPFNRVGTRQRGSGLSLRQLGKVDHVNAARTGNFRQRAVERLPVDAQITGCLTIVRPQGRAAVLRTCQRESDHRQDRSAAQRIPHREPGRPHVVIPGHGTNIRAHRGARITVYGTFGSANLPMERSPD